MLKRNYLKFLSLKISTFLYIGFLLPILSHASFTEHFCIEPLDSLNAHVIREHNAETKQAIDNYKNLKDYKWLHMLPSVGYDTRWNTPVVAVSSTQFVSYFGLMPK